MPARRRRYQSDVERESSGYCELGTTFIHKVVVFL